MVNTVGLALVTALVVAACGARVGGVEDPPDAGGVGGGGPDAAAPADPPDATTAAADNECGVAQSQGDLGTLAAQGSARPQDPDNDDSELLVYSLAALTPGTASQPTPDAVYIELWDGYGVFADGGATPGTYAIEGEELSYATCGVCVFVLADLDDQGAPTRILQAIGGTIEVRAVSPELDAPLSVAIDDVRFQEVSAEDFTPQMTDCESPVDRAQLDATLASIGN